MPPAFSDWILHKESSVSAPKPAHTAVVPDAPAMQQAWAIVILSEGFLSPNPIVTLHCLQLTQEMFGEGHKREVITIPLQRPLEPEA